MVLKRYAKLVKDLQAALPPPQPCVVGTETPLLDRAQKLKTPSLPPLFCAVAAAAPRQVSGVCVSVCVCV
jgi:hypothetical protein